MASWRRLTNMNGVRVDVNLDNVAYMHRVGEDTEMIFVGGRSDHFLVLVVKESPDDIHGRAEIPE